MSKTARESKKWRKRLRDGKLKKVPVWEGIEARRQTRQDRSDKGRKSEVT